MLITKRLDELMPDEFTRILSPEKGSALDAKTVVLGSQEHACCSLNAGTLDIKASREFSNTVQKAYVRAKVNAPAQKAGWGFAPRPAVNTPTEPAPTLKVTEVTDTTSATRIDLPILVYETKRKPGLNSDGTPAADMLYGDMTKEEITAIPTYMYTRMFAVDSWMVNFDSSGTFFADFRKMATRYFSMGDLEMVILAMIAKFEKKEGGEFRHPALTHAVRAHPETQAFVTRLLAGINGTILIKKGEINALPLEEWMQRYNKENENKLRPPAFHRTSDILGGLTMSINDVWAAKAELVQYDRVGRFYTGKVRVTFYDHFGLDIPDIGPDPTNGSIKKYGLLPGFRSWFILQHLKSFGYRPFVTVMEMDYPIKGTL